MGGRDTGLRLILCAVSLWSAGRRRRGGGKAEETPGGSRSDNPRSNSPFMFVRSFLRLPGARSAAGRGGGAQRAAGGNDPDPDPGGGRRGGSSGPAAGGAGAGPGVPVGVPRWPLGVSRRSRLGGGGGTAAGGDRAPAAPRSRCRRRHPLRGPGNPSRSPRSRRAAGGPQHRAARS